MSIRISLVGVACTSVLCTASANADCQYSQDFETNSTAQWTVNGGPSDETANFFFDYSTVGIPAAPSGKGTRGMKLQANLSSGIFGGFSVSPTGESFTGDYTVRFDWWSNVNGPFPAGGSGSTNLSTFGIGTVGNTSQWVGSLAAIDSVFFAATGDGNSTADYRAYSSAAQTSYPDGSTVYEAPSRNCSDPYYASFGNIPAPAAQAALFPQQSGNTLVGSAGMEWHDVQITKSGKTVTWHIDGLLIATIDLTTVTISGTNIHFGHSDTNTTSSTDVNDVNLLFTLIDNIRVGTGDPCTSCPGDLVTSETFAPPPDGTVDAADLAYLLGNWGDCE